VFDRPPAVRQSVVDHAQPSPAPGHGIRGATPSPRLPRAAVSGAVDLVILASQDSHSSLPRTRRWTSATRRWRPSAGSTQLNRIGLASVDPAGVEQFGTPDSRRPSSIRAGTWPTTP